MRVCVAIAHHHPTHYHHTNPPQRTQQAGADAYRRDCFNCTPADRAQYLGNAAALAVLLVRACVRFGLVWFGALVGRSAGWLNAATTTNPLLSPLTLSRTSAHPLSHTQEPERPFLLSRLRRLTAAAANAAIYPTTNPTTTTAAATTAASPQPRRARVTFHSHSRHHHHRSSSSPSSPSSDKRLRLARAVLRAAVVGVGITDGDGGDEGQQQGIRTGGLHPDVFDELVAFCRPPWDLALAAGKKGGAGAGAGGGW